MFKHINILFVSLLLIAPAKAAQPIHALDIVNRAPKFEKFYNAAQLEKSDEASRWSLWQKDYGIAAVPPTPAGDTLARRLTAMSSQFLQ